MTLKTHDLDPLGREMAKAALETYSTTVTSLKTFNDKVLQLKLLPMSVFVCLFVCASYVTVF